MTDDLEALPRLGRLVAYLTNATVHLLRREEASLELLGRDAMARGDQARLKATREELARLHALLGQIAAEAEGIADESTSTTHGPA